jgi:tetratricopeptide (TPR) repeat protein
MGDLDGSLAACREALDLVSARKDPVAEAGLLAYLNATLRRRGEYAKALLHIRRALEIAESLERRADVAAAYAGLGMTYQDMGDHERALPHLERGLAIARDVGAREKVLSLLCSVAEARRVLGDLDAARACEEEALALARTMGAKVMEAEALASLSATRYEHGDLRGALEARRRSAEILDGVGNRIAAGRAWSGVGTLQLLLGKLDEGVATMDRVSDLAAELGVPALEAEALHGAAEACMRRGEPGRALPLARRAVRRIATLGAGLRAEAGAIARERWSDVYALGMRASASLDDPDAFCFFLESGRATALLGALGGRDAVRAASVPEALRRAEAAARVEEASALASLRRAVEAGVFAEVTARRRDLERARAKVEEVVERIHLEAAGSAQLVYARPDPLPAIQARLRSGDAAVLYALLAEEGFALLVTEDASRIVPLGPTKAVVDACAALAVSDPDADPEAPVLRLAKLLIEPLHLGKGTRRLLVSPHRDLCYLPFVLLVGDRDVTYIPSATTAGVLATDSGLRGTDVLALGDPDYGALPGDAAPSPYRSGRRLVRLPGSGDEARAVGDCVLVRKEASETGLRAALPRRPRWRAVHLACHGLVDGRRPLLTSLALAADEENDGFLTALDVLQLRIPADLVVLSACETARGKIYATEGVVGLPPAFLHAGAPRVVVSLWKVDDEATRALMQRFYASWKSGRTPAASALREAQRQVASQEKWRHPRYWAAWQLWGLAN